TPPTVLSSLSLHDALPIFRSADVSFQENRLIAKSRLRLRNCHFQLRLESFLAIDHSHPLASATGSSFDQYGETDIFRLPFSLLYVVDGLGSSFNQRYIIFHRCSFRR